ncbi:MAG: hypothetical protein ACPG7F_00015 [Aggregatilineales bacterium]
MATANDNNAFLSIDGIDVSGVFTDKIEPEESAETQDVTRGAGQEYMQRAVGLKDIKISFVVAYDTVTAAAHLAKMQPGKYPIVYGPQSNSTGMPKLDADFIVTSIKGITTTVKKEAKVFEVSAELADTPRSTLATGTF